MNKSVSVDRITISYQEKPGNVLRFIDLKLSCMTIDLLLYICLHTNTHSQAHAVNCWSIIKSLCIYFTLSRQGLFYNDI